MTHYETETTALQRARFALGTLQRLRVVESMQKSDNRYGIESLQNTSALQVGREAVWAAEYAALQRDPAEAFIPTEALDGSRP